jgi:hypothetical protein
MLIAVTPRQFPLKDDNALRLVNAFMRDREWLLGRGVRYQRISTSETRDTILGRQEMGSVRHRL